MEPIADLMTALSILLLQAAILRCAGVLALYRGRSWRQRIRLWFGLSR